MIKKILAEVALRADARKTRAKYATDYTYGERNAGQALAVYSD